MGAGTLDYDLVLKTWGSMCNPPKSRVIPDKHITVECRLSNDPTYAILYIKSQKGVGRKFGENGKFDYKGITLASSRIPEYVTSDFLYVGGSYEPTGSIEIPSEAWPAFRDAIAAYNEHYKGEPQNECQVDKPKPLSLRDYAFRFVSYDG